MKINEAVDTQHVNFHCDQIKFLDWMELQSGYGVIIIIIIDFGYKSSDQNLAQEHMPKITK